MGFLIAIIQVLSRVFSIVVIADVILSYFMSPYHPIRVTLGKIIEPFLAPIRRIVPAAGGIDFSPVVLLILVQVVEYLLVITLSSLG